MLISAPTTECGERKAAVSQFYSLRDHTHNPLLSFFFVLILGSGINSSISSSSRYKVPN